MEIDWLLQDINRKAIASAANEARMIHSVCHNEQPAGGSPIRCRAIDPDNPVFDPAVNA